MNHTVFFPLKYGNYLIDSHIVYVILKIRAVKLLHETL